MKNSSLRVLLFTLLIGAPSASRADVVFLNHGGKLEGRIVERNESSVQIDIGAGSLTIPMSSVDRIEEGVSPLHEYEDRAAKLGEQDREGWLELARWASRAGLGTQSLLAFEQLLKIDPNDPEANRALGRVRFEGQWTTQDEAYRARGYVSFEGRWMMPAERDSILRSREADQAAQARVGSAEARASEAEARASEAEAQARRRTYGAPTYWTGWGPGPEDWVVVNPLDRPGRFGKSTQGQP